MAASTAPTTPTKATSAEDHPPSPRRSTRVRKPTFKVLDAANQHNKHTTMNKHKHAAANQHDKPATEQHNKHAAPNQDKPATEQHDNNAAASDHHNDNTKRAPSPTTSEPPLKRPRYKYAGPLTRHRASLTPRPRVIRKHTPPAAAAAASSSSSSSSSSLPPPSTPRSHHRRTASRDNANHHLNKGPAYLSSPDRKRAAAENKEGEEKEYSDWEYCGPTESKVRNAALGGFGAFFFAPYDGTVGGGGAGKDKEVGDAEEEMEGGEEGGEEGEEGAVADVVTGKVNRGYGFMLGP